MCLLLLSCFVHFIAVNILNVLAFVIKLGFAFFVADILNACYFVIKLCSFYCS